MSDAFKRLFGAAVGGALGVIAYNLALRYDVHVLAAVGAGVALGSNIFAVRRSVAWGIVIAAIGLGLSIVVEWHYRPFVSGSGSLAEFVVRLPDLPWRSQVSLVAAAALGFYFGRRGRCQARASTTA